MEAKEKNQTELKEMDRNIKRTGQNIKRNLGKVSC